MKRTLFFIGLSLLLTALPSYTQELPQWLVDYIEAEDNYDFAKADEIFNANFDRNNSDCCFINGHRHVDKGNYDWAIGWLERAIEIHTPTNYFEKSSIYKSLADIYNQLEKYEQALDCLIKAKDENYNNGKASSNDWMQVATQYEIMEQYANAEDSYYHILNYESDHVDAKIALAYLYWSHAPKEDSVLLDSIAYSLVNEILINHSSSSSAYYARAQYNAIRKEDYKAAIDDYLSFLYYDQDNTNATDGLYYCAMLEFQYAITAINQWVKHCNPKERREKNKYFFIRKRAKVYENNAYYREAIDDYTEVLEDDPDGTNKLWALPSRGDCYLHIYDYQNAINDYTKYIDLNEDFDDRIYLQRALAYAELGKYEDAMNDYTMVIKNSDFNHYIGYAHYRRGWIKEFLKDDYGALRDYNRGIEADSTYAYLYLMRGETYQRFNDMDKAMLDYKRVLELDTIPEDGSCRQYALFFLGDSIGAVDWMKRIIDTQPEDEGHYYDMACLYARMGKLYESIEALTKAFEWGYRRIAHVKIDDDLDPIRELPEYKALIEKYEAESSTQQIEELLKQERSKMSDKDKLDLLREFNY